MLSEKQMAVKERKDKVRMFVMWNGDAPVINAQFSGVGETCSHSTVQERASEKRDNGIETDGQSTERISLWGKQTACMPLSVKYSLSTASDLKSTMYSAIDNV